jgi:hypothetical protein
MKRGVWIQAAGAVCGAVVMSLLKFAGTEQPIQWWASVLLLVAIGAPRIRDLRADLAVYAGVYAVIAPLPLLGTAIAGVLLAWWLKYWRAALVLAVSVSPVGVWLMLHPGWLTTGAAIVASGVVVWRERGEIAKLRGAGK